MNKPWNEPADEDPLFPHGTFKGADLMLGSQVTPTLILRARPDRRADDRYVHSQPVQINGVPAVGRDISTRGMAVITTAPMSVGDIVRVTVADAVDSPGPMTCPARVARIDRRAERQLIGLQFI